MKLKDKIKKYIKKLYEIIKTPSMSYLPGNLAFYLVLSIFPIFTLVGVISSFFHINVGLVINLITNAFPKDVSDVLITFIKGKGFDTNIGIFMIVGFFLASNGTDAIVIACNDLYGFKDSNYIERRIKAILLIILLVFAFLFLILIMGFGSHLFKLLLSYIGENNITKLIYNLFIILRYPLTLFILFFNVKLIYTIAPDSNIKSSTTTLGALFTTLSWIIVVRIYSFWITNFSNYDIFYGSLSNIVILMLIIYIIAYIFVIGIAINVKNMNKSNN